MRTLSSVRLRIAISRTLGGSLSKWVPNAASGKRRNFSSRTMSAFLQLDSTNSSLRIICTKRTLFDSFSSKSCQIAAGERETARAAFRF